MNKKSTNVPPLTSAPNKLSQKEREERVCCCITTTIIILVVIGTLVTLRTDSRGPCVALESIALSLQDDHGVTNGTMAKWDVTVSIENRNTMSYLEFGELSVWVNCMSESSSQAVIPGFKLGVGRGAARFVKGTVKSSLTDHARSQLVHGSVVDVLLRGECGHRYWRRRTVKFACRDVGVGVLSGATRERKYCTVVQGFDASDSCKRDGPVIIYVKPGRRSVSTVATI